MLQSTWKGVRKGGRQLPSGEVHKHSYRDHKTQWLQLWVRLMYKRFWTEAASRDCIYTLQSTAYDGRKMTQEGRPASVKVRRFKLEVIICCNSKRRSLLFSLRSRKESPYSCGLNIIVYYHISSSLPICWVFHQILHIKYVLGVRWTFSNIKEFIFWKELGLRCVIKQLFFRSNDNSTRKMRRNFVV